MEKNDDSTVNQNRLLDDNSGSTRQSDRSNSFEDNSMQQKPQFEGTRSSDRFTKEERQTLRKDTIYQPSLRLKFPSNDTNSDVTCTPKTHTTVITTSPTSSPISQTS
ncbi:hypothetical protein DINM_006557 [Dirofilaria immitis]|nr:hypothetical protein [Dirofilaria immitis]